MITITDEQIAALNAARDVLDQITTDCNAAGYEAFSSFANGGRLEEAFAQDYARVGTLADVAENAIFQTLNTMNAHRVHELTHDQLHRTAAEVSVDA